MKKSLKQVRFILLATFFAFCSLALTACNFNLFVPKTVTINGTTYRNGFYGDLWPENLTFKSGSYKVGGNEFNSVDNKQFDWILSQIGGKDPGVLYCAENQWKQASAYYADNDNFVYYCRIGAQYTDRDPVLVTIPTIDPSKFDALMAFANKNDYKPFGSNKGVKTIRLPMPDRDKSPELVFYKESKDRLFTSYQGDIFHVVDGKLFLLYQYDFGHGKYEQMVAVNVPAELGQYFIGLLKQLTK